MYKYLTLAALFLSISAPANAIDVKTNSDSNGKLTETFNQELDVNNDGSVSADENLTTNAAPVDSSKTLGDNDHLNQNTNDSLNGHVEGANGYTGSPANTDTNN